MKILPTQCTARPFATLGLLLGLCAPAWSADHGATAPDAHAAPAKKAASAPAAATSADTHSVGEQVRQAVAGGAGASNKQITLVVNGKEKKFISIPALKKEAAAHAEAAPAEAPAHASPAVAKSAPRPHAPIVPSHQYARARAAALTGHSATPAQADAHAQPAAGDAHGGEVHWSYEGETGPQAWGRLKPEFNICAIGKRQSPINIEESQTLQGPAEPLQFNYTPSNGSVINNGHTIQVDLSGDNTLTVRGSTYRLVQFHFHTPSEEQVNYRGFAMVAHLVHRNSEGQLAVVAVLLDTGSANSLINKIWTYMPLDTNDRVRMPVGLVDMNEILPKDQRYYQFIGSLTTPPCTEGVLWMVFKQPVTISREQWRLFTQVFPHNARPVQPLNGRPVRDAQ